MSYLDTIKFQYYPNNIKIVKPLGEITLGQFLKAIKHPKPEILKIFKEIEEASLAGDLKRKAELKSKLFYIVPTVMCDGNGRSYDNVVSYTGCTTIDFDNLDVEYAKELKEFVFHNYDFVIASFLSASKKGCKVIIKIPVANSLEEFKSIYYGVLAEFQYFKGIDFSPKNAVLSSYLTYDQNLLYRMDAVDFTGKGMQVDEFKPCTKVIERLEEVDPRDVEGIKLMFKRMMAKIDVQQTAHLQILSIGLLAGGYVAMNYMDFDEMQEYLFELMDETQYMHKSMKTYKTTLTQMMNRGLLAPLVYER